MAIKENLHGVILLDKPSGMSSNHALQKVKHLVGAKKAGHTGSLDPIATGLLPICLGQATKVAEYLLHTRKRYYTVLKLGESTDTYDIEGEVLEKRPVAFSDEQLEDALDKFRGEIEQIPPMYSALKKGGTPLYKLARQGEEVAREPRRMTVFHLSANRLSKESLALDVQCSSGFYIRSLAFDLGQELGCGAHVAELRRTGIKELSVDKAVSLKSLEESDNPRASIQDIGCLLQSFPVVTLNDFQVQELKFGRKPEPIDSYDQSFSGLCRFVAPDHTLFAVGTVSPNGELTAHKKFILDD